MVAGAKLVLVLALASSAACAATSKEQVMRKAMLANMMQRQDWPAAFAITQDLLAEAPEDAEVLTARGIIYREQGLSEQAEADLDQAIDLDDDLAAAHSALAILLDSQHRFEEAELAHRQAQELEPDNQDYANNLGFCLYLHGKPREAVAVLKEALRINPTSTRVRNNLGFAYARLGDLPRASEQFSQGGPPAVAMNNLGFAYEKQGNLAQAYDLYLEAVRLNPDLNRARENLLHVANQIGRDVPEEIRDKATGETGELPGPEKVAGELSHEPTGEARDQAEEGQPR
ncbi:tetratricopeptide repeat protein [Myxococcota bacterium]